jgi:hypothetical protein
MKQEAQKVVHRTKQQLIILAALIGIIGIASITGCVYVSQKPDTADAYGQTANQSGISNVRELILLAVRGAKKDAPVEPKTGDIYFPESKLFLPNPHMVLPLTYVFDEDAVSGPIENLSISTYPVRGSEGLYTAQNNEELFAAVPKLQACSRGIKLSYEQFPISDTDDALQHTIHLSNGKTLYMYLEKACPDLKEAADALQAIQAY